MSASLPANATGPGNLLLGVPFRRAHRLVPGLVLAAGGMVFSTWLAGCAGEWVLRAQGLAPNGKNPVSAIMVVILVGMIAANTTRIPELFAPGLKFVMTKILRLGIVLVGIKLSFIAVLQLGACGVPVVFCVIVGGFVFSIWFARRIGLSDRMGALAAASTSICGVTAALAVAPVVDAEDREVTYTIANVTIFGLLAMFLYPYLAHALFADRPGAAGLFLGTSIHETGQVVGAALNYKLIFQDDHAFQVATITKLTRNLFLIGVVPLLGYLHARHRGTTGQRTSLAKLFPVFVLGFVAMAVLRSLGDLSFGEADRGWISFHQGLGETCATWALGTAMAGVGLSTRFGVFKALGWKPVLVGAAAALAVGTLGLGLAAMLPSRL